MLRAGYRWKGQVLRPGDGKSEGLSQWRRSANGSKRTITRSWAWPRRPRTRTSRAPIASWPSSTTPMPTLARTSASRKSRPPTRCSATQAKRKEYDEVRTLSENGFAGNPFAGAGAGGRQPGGGFSNFRVDDLGDLLGNIFGRGSGGGPGRRAGTGPRPAAGPGRRSRAPPVVCRRGKGCHHHRQRDHRRCPARPAAAAGLRPGTAPTVCSVCGGPGRDQRKPGHVLVQPPVRGMRGHGYADRGAVPHLRGPGHRASRPAGKGAHPRRGRGRAADKGEGPGRCRTVRRPRRRPVRRRPHRPPPGFRPEGQGPDA